MTKKVAPAKILKLGYSRVFVPEEGGGFSGSIREFPGCFAEGDTVAEAYANLESAAESWIEAAQAQGMTVPSPPGHVEASGKFVLRVPRSLHTRLQQLAEEEGTSLNQLVGSVLAERVGAEAAFGTSARKIDTQLARALRSATHQSASNEGFRIAKVEPFRSASTPVSADEFSPSRLN
jgi:antitoxin HicB